MKLRTVIILITVILAVLLLQGCGGKESVQSDLTFMYWADSPKAAQAYTSWLTEFHQTAGYLVEEQYAPFGEGYNQKLLILIGAKQAPDMFLLPPDYLPTFIQKGALLPLDDYVNAEKMIPPAREEYPQVFGEDGKLYAIPVNRHTTAVIFSRSEKANISWDLLKFILKKLQEF